MTTNLSACSDKFPSTSVFYEAISDDVASIVLLSIACVLAVICIGIFIEELVFLQQVHFGNELKVRKVATILGLYPVTIITSVISLLVPASTLLLDLIASCYLSVCFYTFVTLTIDYFGGEDRMIEIMSDHKVRLSVPPCCCCCCCILKPITLSKRALLVLKLFALQVAVIRPILVFIAAVLWTDGKYQTSMDGSSSYIYITVITAVSTMFSMYGTVAIVRGCRLHLQQYSLYMKFNSFYLMVVLINIQNLVFGILGSFNIPGCIGSRGSKVRASSMQHAILVMESFLLCLLARKAYRVDDTEIEPPTSSVEAGFVTYNSDNVKRKQAKEQMSKAILNVNNDEVDTVGGNGHFSVVCSYNGTYILKDTNVSQGIAVSDDTEITDYDLNVNNDHNTRF